MTETVLYILGAGFSAPLGLPLMSTFIMRSKDLYAQDSQKYASFKSVFDGLDEMARVKNVFSADLSNIEEVLSILEMDASLSGERTRKTFLSFISGVIEGFTPPIRPRERRMPSNWNDHLFGGGRWQWYGNFVANLFGLAVTRDSAHDSFTVVQEPRDSRYHVITLNYDLVLEDVLGFVGREYACPGALAFQRPSAKQALDPDSCAMLCKLHGSIDAGPIVPPTWNKSLRREILPEWKAAHTALSKANHIRVLGYSLPDGDAYFRYLLKAGVLRSNHLKSFDVVCLDDGGTVAARYEAFVDFPFFRFRSGRTEDYLQPLKPPMPTRQTDGTGKLVFNSLEAAHATFFS
jgi:hypothetical protein